MALDQQRVEGVTRVEPETPLSEKEKKEQRARLIKALGRFRPSDATPLQFYNCVREMCIMHNCSIDEGLERAAIGWPKLSIRQRQLYNSQRHAELPIPVPRHLIYSAFEKERNGLWTLGRSSASNTGQTMYTVEAYKPPRKLSRMRSQLNAKKPIYDNLRSVSPRSAATQSPPSKKAVWVSPASGRRIRSLTPTPVRKLPIKGSKGSESRSPDNKQRKRRLGKKRNRKSGTISPKSWSGSNSPSGSTSRFGSGYETRFGSAGSGSIGTTAQKLSSKQKKKVKSKKIAKKSIKSGPQTNWERAICTVQQYLMEQAHRSHWDKMLVSRRVDAPP
ncbi:uncharacterized protein [Drosophila pseudoobscura]|uniref:Uncharacterized protein n=1 Tax=Drosophila pseudoobscura pseudoobscura TaxID=46245 RepID=A0A6I8V0G6_DROPS|nr:uncharacterized protein LOC6901529 [Drosophila pseudoobscura]